MTISVPVPVYVLVIFIVLESLLALWAIMATLAALRRLPIPIPDLGNYIFPCGDAPTFVALADLLINNGKQVFRRYDTRAVKRVIFTDGIIVNYAEPNVYARMGEPRFAIALPPVKSPENAALDTIIHFKGRGIDSQAIRAFDLEIQPGSMSAVQVKNGNYGNFVIIHRVHGSKMPDPTKKL